MNKLSLHRILSILFSLILISVSVYIAAQRASHNILGYDESYNIQLARNYAESGKYQVSYPQEIIFYKWITTGPSMLVPIALAFRTSGFSFEIISVFPLVCFAIFLIFSAMFFYRITGWMALPLFLLLSRAYYFVLGGKPLGENAALAYGMVSLFFLLVSSQANEREIWKRNLSAVFSGLFLACAFNAKTICICFVLVYFVLLFVERFFAEQKSRQIFIHAMTGFLLGTALFELFKLLQFDWQLADWCNWWRDSVQNLFEQSGTSQTTGGFSQMLTRWRQIARDTGENRVALFFKCVLPPSIYLLQIISHKVSVRKASLRLPMALHICGVGGASLLIFLILAGSDGILAQQRRYFFYLTMVDIYLITCAFLLGNNICRQLHARQSESSDQLVHWLSWGAIVLFGMVFCIGPMFQRSVRILFDESRNCKQYTQEYQIMQEMAQEIKKLPEDTPVYVWGWWQAPELNLLSGRRFTDMASCYYNTETPCTVPGFFVCENGMLAPMGNGLLPWLDSIAHYETIYRSNFSESQPELYSLFRLDAIY